MKAREALAQAYAAMQQEYEDTLKMIDDASKEGFTFVTTHSLRDATLRKLKGDGYNLSLTPTTNFTIIKISW